MTSSYLDGLAREVPGLNYAAWQTESTSPALTAQVAQEEKTAASEGLDSTPSLIVSGPKATDKVVGVVSYASLEQTIKSVA